MHPSRTSRALRAAVTLATATAMAVGLAAGPASAASAPILLTVDPAGAPGDQQSRDASISRDGRFVAFESYAANLVPGDSNGQRDIFLRDLRTRRTELVSVGRTGGPANGESLLGVTAISADGRFVVFRSAATDLVAGADRNGDGHDVYLRDRATRSTVRISRGTPLTHNERPSISGDGRFVAFVADDGTLVPGDTNLVPDVFVYDHRSVTVRRASVGPAGAQADELSSAPVLSGNGRYLAFLSFARNLDPRGANRGPHGYRRDLRTGRTERVSYGLAGDRLRDGIRHPPSISADGRLVTYAAYDGQVYLRDVAARRSTLVSAGAGGVPGDQFSHTPRLSPDGRHVTFVSAATNLAPPHPSMTTIYRRDLTAGSTTRLTVNTVDGAPVEGGTYLYTASDTGVVFASYASNIDLGNQSRPAPGYADQLYLVHW